MRAVAPKIPVSFARDPRVRFGDWLDHDVRLSDELIESAACDGIMAPVDNDPQSRRNWLQIFDDC
jgi:hypothetical protein